MLWASLLTEPTAMIAWCLVALVAAAYRQPAAKALRVGLSVVAAVYFWFATPIGANVMVGMLEADAAVGRPCPGTEAAAAVVVLGGGASGVAASAEEIWRLQEAGYRRTVRGVQLATGMADPTLILSGGSGGEVAEAELMRTLAIRLGMPPDRIFIERRSRSTSESAFEVARLLRGRGINAFHLVTSASHMRRAAGLFEAEGFLVCRNAVDFKLVRPAPREALIPQLSALAKSTTVVHEVMGLLWYRASGGLDARPRRT